MAEDLAKLTKKQLEKRLADVQKALKAVEAKERKAAKKAAEQAAAKFGFSLAELTQPAQGAKRGPARKTGPKTQLPPKYADPQDKTKTWTGRGRQPQWFKDAVAAGTDPKTLEI
jgi:DNA-binding protein H-NS